MNGRRAWWRGLLLMVGIALLLAFAPPARADGPSAPLPHAGYSSGSSAGGRMP